MSHQLVEDMQKKACPKVAVSQACRILDISHSGYYARLAAYKQRLGSPAVCAASVHLKAVFAASHRACSSGRLRTVMAERGSGPGQTPGAHFDEAQWSAPCLAAQARSYNPQQACSSQVGWAMAPSMPAGLVCAALQMASFKETLPLGCSCLQIGARTTQAASIKDC